MCVLPRLPPIREYVPDDAIVSLANEELEGAHLSRVATTRPPASRARKLGASAHNEGAEPQDFFVSQHAMCLPATGRAHAVDECSDRNVVFGTNVNFIQVLFERGRAAVSIRRL